MASVIINSGPPDPAHRPTEQPREKWRMLMWVKRDFLRRSITFDCRSLLEFIQDAEEMWQELGFDSAEHMIREGYELDPIEVQYALDWLKVKSPDEAVGFEVAVKGGRRLGSHGGDRKSEEARENQGNNVVLKNTSLSNPSYILARLERDRPDILNEFHQGVHKSARAAGIAAGIIKVPSNYEQAIKAIDKLTPDELLMLKEYLGA